MVTKFIEPWILFPGNLVILLLILSTLLRRTRRRLLSWGRPPGTISVVASILAITAVLLYLFSIDPVSRVLMGRLEDAIPATSPTDLAGAEAIVVLGGGVVWNTPAERLLNALDGAEATGSRAERDRSSLSVEAESRLLYGVRLARRLDIPLVVSGGRVLSAPEVPREADVASRLALELGLPNEMVLIESASRTTAENASLTQQQFGFERVIVVTSAYHMRRSLLAFARVGTVAVPAPAAYRSDRRPFRPVMLMPDATNLRDSTTVFRERLGFLWYRLTT